MPVSLSSTLVDAGLVPLYLFGATVIVRGVPYCVAVPCRSRLCCTQLLTARPSHPTPQIRESVGPTQHTNCPWLNRVEAWFSTRQRQVMDRGSFDDVADLQATLGRYLRSHNRRATPPQWNVKADAILAQLTQIRRTYETVH